MTEMSKFVYSIARKVEPYLARHGGPIILSQIENEYSGNMEYVNWCGGLAQDLNLDIPWIMCNGDSANGTLNSCNDFNCVDDGYVARHAEKYPNKPLLLTENWSGYEIFGSDAGKRATDDLAYSVAGWVAAGGSYMSYYMWHGGNHYGISAAPSIATMYANDVNLRSDGTLHEPKYTHLGNLHKLIAKHSDVILSGDAEMTKLKWWNKDHWEDGTQQQSYTYRNNGRMISFIYSSADGTTATLFSGKNFSMSAKSVVIVDEKLRILYNTSKVPDNIPNMKVVPIVKDLSWQAYAEETNVLRPVIGGKTIPIVEHVTPREQLNVTKDDTARLWYRTRAVFTTGDNKLIIATRNALSLLVFVNGEYKGEWKELSHTQGNAIATIKINMKVGGEYLLEILSISFGLDNDVRDDWKEQKGIVGMVALDGKDITKNSWYHQKGISGEVVELFTDQGRSLVKWDSNVTKYANRPLVWYHAQFSLKQKVIDAAVSNPVLVTVTGLQRGHIYVNGFDIGMYWTIASHKEGKPTQIDCM
jgi:hypothetical protein